DEDIERQPGPDGFAGLERPEEVVQGRPRLSRVPQRADGVPTQLCSTGQSRWEMFRDRQMRIQRERGDRYVCSEERAAELGGVARDSSFRVALVLNNLDVEVWPPGHAVCVTSGAGRSRDEHNPGSCEVFGPPPGPDRILLELLPAIDVPVSERAVEVIDSHALVGANGSREHEQPGRAEPLVEDVEPLQHRLSAVSL